MLIRLLRDDGGQDIIEYVLLTAGIGVVTIGIWPLIETAIAVSYRALDTEYTKHLGAAATRRWLMNVFQLVAVGVAVVACATDVASRRIPNLLTVPAIAVGLTAHAMPGGHGLAAAFIGLLVGLAVFFPFFALGGMGGGDVKLMAALGTWVGWSAIVWTGLYGAVAGGVLAVAVALASGYLRQALSNIGGLLLFWSAQGIRPMPALTLAEGRGPRLPYAFPILVGLVAALWRG